MRGTSLMRKREQKISATEKFIFVCNWLLLHILFDYKIHDFGTQPTFTANEKECK